MGDLNTSNCSWNKLVLARANNLWISTVNSKTSKPEMNTQKFCLRDTDNASKTKGKFAAKCESDTHDAKVQNLPNSSEIKQNITTLKYETEDNDDNSYEVLIEGPESLLIDASPPPFEHEHHTGRRRRRTSSTHKREASEDRSMRLARMSAYAAQRLANESPEARAVRLKRMSEYAARRLSSESAEARAARLQRMSAYAARRIASETPEQRAARLARMSAYAARRQALRKAQCEKSQEIEKGDSTSI